MNAQTTLDFSQKLIRMINEDDLDQVVRIHKNAFPNSLLSQFNDKTVNKYYRLQMAFPNKCYPLGVFQEERLIGFCFGGEFRDMKLAFIRSTLFSILWTLLKKPSIFFTSQYRIRILGIVNSLKRKIVKKKFLKGEISKPHSKRFGILSIAVDPSFQGVGAGRMLAEEIERLAIRDGYDKISLNVHIDNHNAIQFYGFLGYQKILNKDQLWHGLMIKFLTEYHLDQ